MLVVRATFTAKPGQAGKLASQMKEMAAAGNLRNVRVFTDVIADFNCVILDHEVESLSEFEEAMKKYSSDPAIHEKARGYTDLWLSGRREVFRLV